METPAIRTVGLFGNPDKREIGEAIATARAMVESADRELLFPACLAPYLPDLGAGVDHDTLAARSDVIIAFGGDGTMLRAARSIGEKGTPLLGINLGSLGYLTDIPLPELPQALDSLFAGEWEPTRRERIVAVVKRKRSEQARLRALNDVVINMGSLPRALDMELRLDRAALGRFLGDGLIVSTATGSTAYNLSAGGPIVHPAVQGFLITPICPHSLAVRPIMVPEEMTVELRLHDVGQGATLTADGQAATPLESGDRVQFRTACAPVSLVKFPNSDFFRAMRRKLQWGAIKRRRARS